MPRKPSARAYKRGPTGLKQPQLRLASSTSTTATPVMKAVYALLVVASVASLAQGINPAPQYQDEPANYAYQYAVRDDYSGANYGQNEERNGYATRGEYRVQLPDGRTQIVTYTVADAYSGYVADVRYEGEARYPDAKSNYSA